HSLFSLFILHPPHPPTLFPYTTLFRSTNYEKTPIFRVFEAVKREAERYGVSILESEIVGLVPSAALNAAAQFYLQIEGFKPEQRSEEHTSELLSRFDLVCRLLLEKKKN